MPPHTTKRTTTHLKTKNNQNCQKIELYGSLTIKKLKKKHSFRLVGWTETGGWGERTHGKAVGGRPQGPRTSANPPTQESAPEGPKLLVGSRASD